jgi:hypothetical protein
MSHIDPIRRLASITDEEAARMVSPQTKNDLAEHIMTTASEQVPRRRRRLLYLGVPLATAAAVTAAALAFYSSPGSPGHTTMRNGPARVELAALSFSTQGEYLVVKVKDPLADPARYKREFAAHGMKINLRLVPASPSVVGAVVESELPPSVKAVPAKGECFSGGGACPVGVKIPLTFHGSGSVTFGRGARPGETYTSTNSAFAPGEALHCVDIRGRTVDEALAMLKRHRVSAALFNYDPRPGYSENTADREKIPGTWYVTSAEPHAPGQVTLFVQKSKPGHPEDEAYYRKLMTGCHP